MVKKVKAKANANAKADYKLNLWTEMILYIG